jgi:hypothetical protein
MNHMKSLWSRFVTKISKSETTKFRIVVVALMLFLGLIALIGYGGYAVGVHETNSNNTFTFTFDSNTPYPFIKPILTFGPPKAYGQAQLTSLHDKVAHVATTLPSGSLTRYAYYFKDLNTGEWTGINESDQYDPASMLKVAFATAVYKQEETTPGFLSRELVYTQDIANIQSQFNFAPPVNLKVGQLYSISFLLKEMLSDSDNGAKDLLVLSIDNNILDKMFIDLSITRPVNNASATFTISPQEYSRFLRILYYGTYDLAWEDSNNILKLLSQATFTNGLVAGVPSTVVVAHKYGEHAIQTGGQIEGIELSDCGIVYHPRHPYLICVMTEGKDTLMLANFISKVSQATYNVVDAGY